MFNDSNETLFHEIIKLQHIVHRILPPPHEEDNKPHLPHKGFPDKNHPPFRRENILRVLIDAENGLRQKQIAEIMGIRAPAMSESILKLEDMNYVERKPDPDDGRATRIVLTEKGRARAYEIQDNHTEILNGLFKNLSEDEKNQLIGLLKKINERK